MIKTVDILRGYSLATESYTRAWRDHPATIYVHETPGKRDRVVRTFRHNCVMIVLAGAGSVSGPGGEYPVSAPFAFLARAGKRYNYSPSETWDEYGFVFAHDPEPDFLEPFPDCPWPIPQTQLIEPGLSTLRELCRDPARDGVADQIDLLAQLLAILSWKGPAPKAPGNRQERLYEAERWLRQNFREIASLDGVAMRFGFSEATFRRLWRTTFALAPWQYVLDLRLQEARRLLLYDRQMTIGEVAQASGFDDQRYFATIYRKRFGESPSLARR